MRIYVLLCAAVCIGCTWVKAKPGTEGIALVKPAHVQSCKRLGMASASVKHKMMGVERKTAKVSEELLILAKNEAVALKGDTLVSVSAPDGGSQRFDVYKCHDEG